MWQPNKLVVFTFSTVILALKMLYFYKNIFFRLHLFALWLLLFDAPIQSLDSTMLHSFISLKTKCKYAWQKSICSL